MTLSLSLYFPPSLSLIILSLSFILSLYSLTLTPSLSLTPSLPPFLSSSFSLLGCPNITDTGVGKIAKASERLKYLDLHGCVGVGEFGDHALKEIGAFCGELKVCCVG